MRRLLTGFLLFLACTAAHAQQPDSAATDATATERVNRMKGEAIANADPSLRDPLRGAAPALTFGLSTDKKTAKVQYGTEMDDNALLVALSGPVSEGSDTTTLATQHGLEDFVTGELAYKRVFWKAPATAAQLTEACVQLTARRSCARNDLPEHQRPLFDSFLKWTPTWTVGLDGKVGTKTFNFVDANTLAAGKESHQATSISASAGVFTSSIYFMSLSLSHVSGYKAGKKATICKTAGTAGSICSDGVVGAPTKQSQNVVEFALRQFVRDGQLALNPRFAWDQKERAFSVDLPLYVRSGIDKPFNGGVDVAWDSKQHEVLFSVFVGALPELMR